MQSKRHQYLTSILALASFLYLFSTGITQAQIQDRPKAGPEQKKLEARVGVWQYEGILHDTPLGPGGKFKGKSAARMTLDGLFLEHQGEDKGVYGGKEIAYKYLTMMWYDSATKSYLGTGFDNDGIVGRTTSSVSGNTWTETATMTDSKGTVYRTKSTVVFSDDGKTSVIKGELSADDGKTWTPYWEQTSKKVGK